jgi:rhodanese-related sulfurtransferase
MKKLYAAAGAALLAVTGVSAQSVFDSTVPEAEPKTRDISTNELRRALGDGSATLLDARPRREFAIGHIPGAVNVAARPGMPPHLYVSDVAEIGRLLNGDRSRALILYCNGPTCGKSRRLAAELLAAGYSNVRRYQLGAPGWRLLGGAMETLPEALPYLATDRTAVWIDARDPEAFARGTVMRARNIPRTGLGTGREEGVMLEAKQDGRLPMEDHNTRIIVFGANAAEARAVADAIAGEAFQNVSFVGAPFGDVRSALRPRTDRMRNCPNPGRRPDPAGTP